MAAHQAPEQMLGYLYQVRYALNLLLKNDNENHLISIERFDDIAFSEDDSPKQMIQLKHHVRQQGNLSDASTDVWRTLKVWIDAIISNEDLIADTEFLIITTATAPEGSAASFLKATERDEAIAYTKLKSIADSSRNQEHAGYYSAFINLGEQKAKELLRKIRIIDSASNIAEISNDLRRIIRYSCIRKFEDEICERIEGWWYRKTIDALCSDTPMYFSQRQVRSLIVSTSQQYADDNLPIDIVNFNAPSLEDLDPCDRIFYEQLKLICVGNRRIGVAIRDYYRAFEQRAHWVRNELLYVNELEEYEERLIDEWDHHFARMEDALAGLGSSITEQDKIKHGQTLLTNIEATDIKIRPKVQDTFVMRGSYHILANRLAIGWHVDFQNRLKHLLSFSEGGISHAELEQQNP